MRLIFLISEKRAWESSFLFCGRVITAGITTGLLAHFFFFFLIFRLHTQKTMNIIIFNFLHGSSQAHPHLTEPREPVRGNVAYGGCKMLSKPSRRTSTTLKRADGRQISNMQWVRKNRSATTAATAWAIPLRTRSRILPLSSSYLPGWPVLHLLC